MYQVSIISDDGSLETPAYFTNALQADTFFWSAFHAGLTVRTCNEEFCYAKGPFTYADAYTCDMRCQKHNAEYLYAEHDRLTAR